MKPIEAAIYLLPLQVNKENNSGEPVEDVCKNRANYVVSTPLSDSLGASLGEGTDVRVALFVQPKRAPKIDHPWSCLFSGLQQSRCQTFPRTSNVPGPSPPVSPASPPRLKYPFQRLCLCLRRREIVSRYSHGVECVCLQFPNRPTEETSADKKEEVGNRDEENCKGGARGKSVDQVTAGDTTDDAHDGGERNRCGGFANGNTTNKNDCFKTCIVY